MLHLYTAQVLASQAQHRHFEGVRLDGRVIDKPSLWRSMVTALFTHSTPAPDRRNARHGGLAAA